VLVAGLQATALVRKRPRGECPRICVGMNELELHAYES
jgi:hypothetical protein